MGVFNSTRQFSLPHDKIGAVADDVMAALREQGYEVQGQTLMGGGWDISITRGGMFKTVLGLKTALKLSLSPRAPGLVFAEASVGIAAINSLIEPPKERIIWRNCVDLIMDEAAGKRLAVIGHFPFVERVRPLVKALWVLELDPREGDIPAQEAPNIVPGADVVAITGTTFINHTIDDLLELAKKKKVIVLGPSTILSPALFEFGISALCGINVENHNHVLRHLSQGGSFRHLPGVRYATILR